jgi:hypothetical protein
MEWINVEDRLPSRPEYDWVLVNVQMVPEGWYGVPAIAELRNDVWYFRHDDEPAEKHLSVKVTHWMELPSHPPK